MMRVHPALIQSQKLPTPYYIRMHMQHEYGSDRPANDYTALNAGYLPNDLSQLQCCSKLPHQTAANTIKRITL
jgi:hypothetical protein